MPEPLESDSELAEALAGLTAAERRHTAALSHAVAAAREAAAQVTEAELARWHDCATKLWGVQAALAGTHAGIAHDTSGASYVIRRQLRRSWLGNIVGVGLPLWIFGASLLDHGLVLPLFWSAAVAADIFGRTMCLRVAHVTNSLMYEQSTITPTDATSHVRRSLARARQTDEWNKALQSTNSVIDVDRLINKGDESLREARRLGQKLGLASLTISIVGLISAAQRITPHGSIPWILITTSLVAVFGLACWLTSRSYAGSVEQPPYPRHGSADLIKRHVHFESILAEMSVESFTSRESLARHTTEQMHKHRVLRSAIRALEQRERVLEDARWKVAMIQAERAAISG